MIDLDSLSRDTNHPFGKNQGYYEGFKAAFDKTYGHKSESEQKRIAKSKFLLGGKGAFDRKVVIQGAVELLLGNYFSGLEGTQLADEVKVNSANKSDIDWQVKSDEFTFNIEVKCSVEDEHDHSDMVNPSKMNVQIISGGRLDTLDPITKLMDALRKQGSVGVKVGKNNDNRLKDFLLEGQKKFPPTHDGNTINLLFVACGHFVNMDQWDAFLHAPGGLFTHKSFWQKSDYSSVDAVILSSARYYHDLEVHQTRDSWNFEKTFNIVFGNKSSANFSCIKHEAWMRFFEIFIHHTFQFVSYQNPNPMNMVPGMRMKVFCQDYLKKADRDIYWANSPYRDDFD